MRELYPASKLILQLNPDRFYWLDPHDESSPSNADILWLTPPRDAELSARETIEIAPSIETPSMWRASLGPARRTPGTSTTWDAGGSEADVVASVSRLLIERPAVT